MDCVLQATGLTKRYHGNPALDGLNLELPAGRTGRQLRIRNVDIPAAARIPMPHIRATVKIPMAVFLEKTVRSRTMGIPMETITELVMAIPMVTIQTTAVIKTRMAATQTMEVIRTGMAATQTMAAIRIGIAIIRTMGIIQTMEITRTRETAMETMTTTEIVEMAAVEMTTIIKTAKLASLSAASLLFLPY